MYTRIPPETKYFTGYNNELSNFNHIINDCSVIDVYGEHGIGKSEFCYKVCNQYIEKNKLKPLFLNLNEFTNYDDFFKTLSLSLPKPKQKIVNELGLEETIHEIVYYWESKKYLILIDGIDYVELSAIESLIEACNRYFKKSKLIITSISKPSFKSQNLHHIQFQHLNGISTIDSRMLVQKLKSQKAIPSDIKNPGLILIIASNDNINNIQNNFDEWLDQNLTEDTKDVMIKFYHWGAIPESHYQKLADSTKEKCKTLLSCKFLMQNDNKVYLSPSLLEYFPKNLKNEFLDGVFDELVDVLDDKESIFYLLKMGKIINKGLIVEYARELLKNGKYSEFNILNDTLVSKKYQIKELIVIDIELSTEQENFERANCYLNILEENGLNSEMTIPFINTVCQLSYQSKDIDKFKENFKLFESMISENDKISNFDFLHWKALLDRENHDYRKACAARISAVSTFDNKTQYKTKYNHLYQLGIDLFWVADFKKSYEYSKQAYDLSKLNLQILDQQRTIYNMCIALDELGKENTASTLLKELKELLKKRSNPSLKVSVVFYESNRLYTSNQLISAIDVLEQAKPETLLHGSKNQQVAHKIYISEIYLAMGEYSKSTNSLESAEGLLRNRAKSPFRWRISRLKMEQDFLLLKKSALKEKAEVLKYELKNIQDLREKHLIEQLLYVSGVVSKLESIDGLTVARKQLFDLSINQPQLPSNISKLELDQYALYSQLSKLLLTESNTFDLKNAHLNIESPWLYWNTQAIICLQDCFNANFKNAEERIHEFLKVENNLDNLGFRICKLLFSLSSIIHNYKSNNWDKVSIDLSTCRKIFLNSDKQFSILFSNIFNSVFEKLGFSMSKDIFLNFVLGDSDLYIIPSIMLISNQNLNIVSLEKKKLLFDLIYTLSQCKGNFIDKESLVQKIWDQNYDPDQHDQTLYVNISRLKKIIENELSISDLVINQDSGYSLSKRLTTKIL